MNNVSNFFLSRLQPQSESSSTTNAAHPYQMPQMLQKFGDDFPLRKTGNCLEMSELTYAYFVQAVCVPIECLLKHGVSMFEKRVESQKTSLRVDAMFAFLIISLSENIKKSNDFPQ